MKTLVKNIAVVMSIVLLFGSISIGVHAEALASNSELTIEMLPSETEPQPSEQAPSTDADQSEPMMSYQSEPTEADQSEPTEADQNDPTGLPSDTNPTDPANYQTDSPDIIPTDQAPAEPVDSEPETDKDLTKSYPTEPQPTETLPIELQSAESLDSDSGEDGFFSSMVGLMSSSLMGSIGTLALDPDPGELYLRGEKVWVGDDNNSGNTRPADLDIYLYRNNTLIDTYTTDAAKNWEYEFDLSLMPLVDGNGVAYAYTIGEEDVSSYYYTMSPIDQPELDFQLPDSDDWDKYEPNNEVQIPIDVNQLAVARKGNFAVIWSDKALTQAERDIVEAAVKQVSGFGNPSTIKWYTGQGTISGTGTGFDGAMTVTSTHIIFKGSSTWSLLFQGNFDRGYKNIDDSEIINTYTYDAEPVDVDLGGMKSLDGRDLVDGEFSFTLYESDSAGTIGTLIETVKNVGQYFDFTTLTFSDGEEGTYYYLIKEEAGMLGGVTYDLTEYLVKVIITDDSAGQLEADVTYWLYNEILEDWDEIEADDVIFNNEYEAPLLEVDKLVEETEFSETGEELHYSFTVTNTGVHAFVKLTVNDPRLGIVNLEIDLSSDPLLPGETYTHVFTEPYVVTDADVEAEAAITNIITVVGETEEGRTAEDEDEVTVLFEQILPFIPPFISVTKLVEEESFSKVGDLLHYYFTVKNEGIVPIVKLTINDPKLGIKDMVIDIEDEPLMPGESYTYKFSQAYVVTQADVTAGKIENILTVTGETKEGAKADAIDNLTTPMEKILPYIPSTGENFNNLAGIVILLMGGAVALIAVRRRRKSE